MSETALECQSLGLVSSEDVANCEPCVLITVPRIAIVSGLLNTEAALDMMDRKSSFCWFREHMSLLEEIRDQLFHLDTRELDLLRVHLAGHSTSDLSEPLGSLFRSICFVADDLLSGHRSREFNSLLSRVFQQ